MVTAPILRKYRIGIFEKFLKIAFSSHKNFIKEESLEKGKIT
jgi:hypothetical protein